MILAVRVSDTPYFTMTAELAAIFSWQAENEDDDGRRARNVRASYNCAATALVIGMVATLAKILYIHYHRRTN